MKHIGEKVLLVDDDDQLREMLAEVIEKMAELDVAVACNGRDALRLVKDVAPFVVLTDIKMPEMDGIEFVRCMREMGLEIPVIFMTGHADKEIAISALRLGAVDFLEKPFQPSDLVRALRNQLGQQQPNRLHAYRHLGLNQNLMIILDLILAGRSNQQIASAIDLSESTVKYHIGNLLEKFHVTNRIDLRTAVNRILDTQKAG